MSGSVGRLCSALALPWTPIGRRRIGWGLLFRCGFLLWPMARVYRHLFLREVPLVAVTGSFGKTTATRAIQAALGLPAERHVLWNAGGFLPLALLRTRRGSRAGVLEVGISVRGQMAGYARRLEPLATVVMSVGSEHLATLGSIEAIRDEKANLVRVLPRQGIAVLNGDDENVLWMTTQTDARIVTFGFGEGLDVRAEHVELDASGRTRFRLLVEDAIHNVRIELVGRTAVYPILAAVAVSRVLGVPVEDALSRLSSLPAAPERLEPFRARNGALLLLDTSKSSLETIDVGMEALRAIPAEGKKVAILGDVEGPPGSQGPIYREVGRRLASVVSQIVFVGGRKAYASVSGGAREGGLKSEDLLYVGREVRGVASLVEDRIAPQDVVWLKGRSTQHLGRIGLALAGRNVSCNVTYCPVTPGCATCPMLERRRGHGLRRRALHRRASRRKARS